MSPERLASAQARGYRSTGLWRGASIGDSFLGTCARQPDGEALIDDQRRLTFAALRARVGALATTLEALGVEPGDAVAYQMPSWWESATALLASVSLGAHAVPIVPVLRAREVGFVLDQTRPRVVLAARSHRGVDLVRQIEQCARALPVPPSILVVREPAATEPSHEARIMSLDLASLPAPPAGDQRRAVDPSSIAVIVYTSGSTAAPKGALHTHDTLVAELHSLVGAHGLGPGDRVLMPSPLAHVSGIVHGVLAPALLGTSAVLMDRWDPGAALVAIELHRVTYMIGAPTFLQEMLAHPEAARRDLSSLRLYSCGGASVPAELLRAARQRLPGLVAKRSYGSSEFPTIATTTASDALARGLDTEGRALDGVELRIADDSGRTLAAGVEGEIRARGPDCFLGYADPTLDAEAFDAEGFHRTGDLGVVDADGYLRVTGRVKDIVVRKGEKISARELEDLLAVLPGVAEVAVVALADPATGERACACLRMQPGAAAPTLEAVSAFLRERDLTPHKLPEQVEGVEDFPRTPSGKIHKRLLREQLEAAARALGAAGG